MRTYTLMYARLAFVVGFFTFLCCVGGGSANNANTPNSYVASHNSAAQNSGSDNAGDEDEALILSTEHQVSLKKKGAASFVPIFSYWPFHTGDTLRVGPQSKATVLCTKVCDLGPGDYLSCCIAECMTAVDLQPPPTDQYSSHVAKADLLPSEKKLLAEREFKIDSLRFDETATQLIMANLYTSWHLDEAPAQIEALDRQLDKPEAKQKLSEGYGPVVMKTASFYVNVNQPDKAVRLYNKIIEAPPTANPSANSENEKAAAHSRLADIYEKTGRHAEAIDNLNHAKDIYERQGDQAKVMATESRIKKVKAQQEPKSTETKHTKSKPKSTETKHTKSKPTETKDTKTDSKKTPSTS